ncbi:hypothetical protein D3C85_1338380 [compost metagenome]
MSICSIFSLVFVSNIDRNAAFILPKLYKHKYRAITYTINKMNRFGILPAMLRKNPETPLRILVKAPVSVSVLRSTQDCTWAAISGDKES